MHLRAGSSAVDGYAAAIAKAGKHAHNSCPRLVLLDERSFKLTTLAAESFGCLDDSNSGLVNQFVVHAVGRVRIRREGGAKEPPEVFSQWLDISLFHNESTGTDHRYVRGCGWARLESVVWVVVDRRVWRGRNLRLSGALCSITPSPAPEGIGPSPFLRVPALAVNVQQGPWFCVLELFACFLCVRVSVCVDTVLGILFSEECKFLLIPRKKKHILARSSAVRFARKTSCAETHTSQPRRRDWYWWAYLPYCGMPHCLRYTVVIQSTLLLESLFIFYLNVLVVIDKWF